MKKLSSIFLPLILMAFCSVANAGLVDELDTANNFSSGFGGTTAMANGDSTVTITRGQDGLSDAGIDWLIGGTTNFDLFNQNFVTLTPLDDVDNDGNYDVNILFFDSSGVFVEEVDWFSTTATTLASIDVATLTSNASSAQFSVRIRVLGDVDDTKIFDRFTAEGESTAVPEPSTACLLALGLFPLLRRRRLTR